MDETLLSAARAVKRRRRQRLPALFLFTDAARLADPRGAIARLPRPGCFGPLCGVVLRHDGAPDRAALARDVARLCRARRIPLVVAGDSRLAAALGAGLHLRDGRYPSPARPARRRGGLVTGSAHDLASLRRAARNGADLVFLSPAFATASHPGRRALGPLRWRLLARRSEVPVLALGGIEGRLIRRLSPACAGAGAIGALS